MQKTLFLGGRDIGLKVATTIFNSEKTKNFVEQENKNTIRLTFPNLDFGISSGPNKSHNQAFLRENWDEDAFRPYASEVGSLVPHLLLQGDSSALSMRQLFTQLCL